MKKLLISILVATAFTNVYAKTNVESKLDIPALEKRLNIGKINNVTQTPMRGIYEVMTEDKIFYTNTDGTIIIIGEMIDVVKKENLSIKSAQTLANAMNDKMKSIFTSNLETLKQNAITEKIGDGSRELYIFTNPDCPFCKKLEPELKKLTNVTLYRVMIPSTAEALAKSNTVWCSNDKLLAWSNAMNGVKNESKECITPVPKNIQISNTLRISGTPTLLDKQGNRLVGLKTADKIETFLNGENK